MKNWKSSPLIKTLLVLILCASGALVMWCGFGTAYFGKELFDRDVSFLDSERSKWISRNYAWQIADGYVHDRLDEETYFLQKATNVEYAVAIYNPYTEDWVTDRYSGQTYSWNTTFWFYSDGNHISILDEEPYLKGIETEDSAGRYGRITLFVDESLPKRDDYAIEYELYSAFAKYKHLYLPVTVVSLVVFVIALIMAFLSAGHSRKEEGIRLYWIDRINFEFLLACLGFVLLVHMLIAKEFVGGDYGTEATRIILAILIAMSASLFIFIVLMSLARRIKTKTLASTSLCGMFVYLLKKVPMPIQVFGAAALYLIFRVFISSNQFVVILCDLIVTVFFLLMFANGKQLLKASEKLAAGDLDYRIPEEDMKHMHWFFRKHGEQLNSIAEGMNIAVEEQMKSERMKTELITNVSHDIKTPLTSIINYVDLLQKEHTEEEEKEYLDVLARNSSRLKKLTEDLVEASKASTGNVPLELEKTDVGELVDQSLAEFEEKLKQAELTPVVNIQEGLCVMADGKLLWRILSNLLSNCVKYAMAGTRVYIDAKRDGDRALIAVKNVSREPLNIPAEELTERFVRGDEARSTEGSGLGLNIARSLAVLQNGDLNITIDGDYFKAEVNLPVC